jgi:ECF transporter S component (folate family)
MKYKFTYKIVLAGCMMALDIVASSLLSFYAPTAQPFLVRMGPQHLVQALSGWILGPWWAMGSAVCADVLKFFILPQAGGGFFPGYTLSAGVSGFLFGLLLYRKKVSLGRGILTELLVTVVVSISLNTLWSVILYQKGFWVMILPALPWRIFSVAAYSVLLFAMQKILVRTKLISPPKKDAIREN